MKRLILFLTLSFFSISSFSQATIEKEKTKKEKTKKENSENKLFDNFIISADFNSINSTYLEGVDEENISSFVIKIKKEINLNDNLNLNAGIGYSLGFKYIPFELGFSYDLFKNFSANIGCGLYNITDDTWETFGLMDDVTGDREEPSNNEFGLFFGINYMLNNNLGFQVNYNSIEPVDDDKSLSLTSFSLGLSYKL